jgi:hypothetical protein
MTFDTFVVGQGRDIEWGRDNKAVVVVVAVAAAGIAAASSALHRCWIDGVICVGICVIQPGWVWRRHRERESDGVMMGGGVVVLGALLVFR